MGNKIGEGFYGLVYECTDVWTNQLAAKVLKQHTSYEKTKESAAEELRKLAMLRHPFVTYVFDAFEYRDIRYIITERCVFSLADFFGTDWFAGSVWLMPVARCLLQAVRFLHLNGYVHQDIHPGNVFAQFVRDEMRDEMKSAEVEQSDLGLLNSSSRTWASQSSSLKSMAQTQGLSGCCHPKSLIRLNSDRLTIGLTYTTAVSCFFSFRSRGS
jgi:serine/threonine protein kinase